MLSTISFVVAGLSTGHKIGLASVGAAFILFALVSSFVLPRRNPDFPGKWLGLYVAIAVCFFIAMLTAVLVFGREAKETAATTSSTSTTSGSTSAVAAGKQVFLTAGCTGCHTLKAAGSTGTVGPNLDQLKPSEAAVQQQVIHGGGPMPAFAGKLSTTQIKDVAVFVSTATHS
ncbi:MAG TPA: cytochrome c [Gaiellaceae bacterium]|jgi:cytochrome c553|nr:cytochrome c [Gaiellaceae bacterium]